MTAGQRRRRLRNITGVRKLRHVRPVIDPAKPARGHSRPACGALAPACRVGPHPHLSPQPARDVLRRTVPALVGDVGLAVVQARWGHANRARNWLTRAQGVLLDGHFAVEQEARFRSGLPISFNGTAGVWRREAIEHGGGWTGDTLTEDLDLSMRCALKGWRAALISDLEVPGELPEPAAAWRSQQARWTEGHPQF